MRENGISMKELRRSLSELSEQLKAIRQSEYKLIRDCSKILKENLIGERIAIKRGECMHVIDVFNVKPTYGYIRFDGYGDVFYDDGFYEISDKNPKRHQHIHIPLEDVFSLKVLTNEFDFEKVYASIKKSENVVKDSFKEIFG